MVLQWPPRLALVLLALLPPPSLGCPSGCRCYSLAVECGSLGLREIPPGAPASTQSFFLQDNALVRVRRPDLARLGRLQRLYLQNNSVSALEPGVFLGQGRLLELGLDHNLLRQLPAHAFRGLGHLRILYLAGNHIRRVEDHAFTDLQRLQELHLQQNGLEVLEERALSGLASLALLDLSRNRLRSLGPASLMPLLSLQVLRVTENPWRCDCALSWLRPWLDREDGDRLTPAGPRPQCSSPPHLARLGLDEVASGGLACLPPAVRLGAGVRATARPGESVSVSCLASGYPRPRVTWRRPSPGPEGGLSRGGGGDGGEEEEEEEEEEGGERDGFDPDTGSGTLFLSNVTAAHAGPYECEARNPGGVASVTFQLTVNTSSSSAFWPGLHSPPSSSSSFSHPQGEDVGPESERMDFAALGPATQAAVAVSISLLALTALLLLLMIYGRHRRRRREGEGGGFGGSREESVLYAADYDLEGSAPLGEYWDEWDRHTYVPDRPAPQGEGPRRSPAPQGAGPRRSPAQGGGVGPRLPDPEGLCTNQSRLFGTQAAYEIHC